MKATQSKNSLNNFLNQMTEFKYPSLYILLVTIVIFSIRFNKLGHTQELTANDINNGELYFKVVDIQRPLTRYGKTLTSPRYIYLQASREPTVPEARKLASSEIRALKRRTKRRRGRAQRKVQKEMIGPQAWERRLLKAFRFGPPRASNFPTPAHERYFDHLRSLEKKREAKRKEYLETLASEGSPIALTRPTAPSDLLESSDDDDEILGEETGEICGHQGEPCCKQTTRGPCDIGLMCVEDHCALPPPLCGGFEQICCSKGRSCIRDGLKCLTSDSGIEQCLFPPPPAERVKTPIGILEIIEVQGQVVKALVRYDALKPQGADQPLNALRRGDLAIWY